MLLYLLVIVAVLLLILYYLSTYKFNYWKKRNVPYLKPTPLLGNYGSLILLKDFIGLAAHKIVQAFPDEPYIGVFYGTEPALMVQDPELIKLITTKDFASFNGREINKYCDRELVTTNMFFTYGDRWKALRQNFSSLFTSGKMRNMFPHIVSCTVSLEKLIEDENKISSAIDTRTLISRYTIDSITTCAYGIGSRALEQTSVNNPFRNVGNQIFEISTLRACSINIRAIWPAVFYGLGLQIFPNAITDFFRTILLDVFEKRDYKPSARHDFADLLLSIKNENTLKGDSIASWKTESGKFVHLEVDDELLIGQCVMIFAAGFDTSASTLSFTLYELSKNEELQKRAIEEVDEYLRARDGKLDYDCLTLPFLEACLYETLRMYPVISVITREVTEDYTLPTGLKLEKGLRIHIPAYTLHHNPKYFPDPQSYQPDRFYLDNAKLHTPYTFLPFGEGPRLCLGKRFAKMQVKAGLVTILRNYRLEKSPETSSTLVMDPKAGVTQANEKLMLKFIKREGAPFRNV